MKKRTNILNITLLVAVLIFMFVPSPVLAAAGDETTVGAISLVPTVECIGVTAAYSGDNNGNNSVVLQYRKSGTGTWITGMDMYADRASKECRASVLGLSGNTLYEVRVVFSDGDSVAGTNPATGSATTMNDTPPLGTVHTYYVSTTGSDTSGDGSVTKPWRTIQKAASTVVAGDTVYVRAGTYNEKVTITADGNAGNYISFLPYSGESVTLDGTNGEKSSLFYLNAANYIRIKGFNINNSYNDSGILVYGSSSHCIIEDNTITNPARTSVNSLNGGVDFRDGPSYCIAQRNKITVNTSSLAAVHGFVLDHAGNSIVVRNNTITGNPAILRDGITCSPEDVNGQKNFDFYNNTITNCYDEDIQLDGNGENTRVWGNKCYSTTSNYNISINPITAGPCYIFRNTILRVAFKMGPSLGRIYIYHNTTYGVGNYIGANSGVFGNIISRNNLAQLTNKAFHFDGLNENGTSDFDYDDFSTSYNIYAKWNTTNYYTFDAFKTGSNQESHGWNNSDHKFTDAAGGDYTLQADSPDIDKGIIIPGFNDANSPWPYRGSGPDIGAYEYVPLEPLPPVLAPIGNKAVHPDVQLQFTVSATDPNGGTLTYSAGNLPAGAVFTPATRTFTWTPTQAQVGNYPGVHFEVTDGTFVDFEDITINVTLNQAPVLTSPGDKSVNENVLLSFTVSASDPDGDPLTYSAANLPSGAAFNAATRTFSWTPSYSQAGTYPNVQFSVTDGGLSDLKNITITVNNVNRPPVLNPIGNKSVIEGQNLTFTVSASDPDGDTVTYSADTLPVGAVFDTDSHQFSWTSASPVGTYTGVHFGASDGTLTGSETITITVMSIPSSPPAGGGGSSGGGGGTGGGGGISGITSLRNSQTSSGLMVEDVTAADINQKVNVVIKSGTIVKNRNGLPITSVRITPEEESQPANSGSRIIGQSYEIEPSGTTFEAYATLVFKYSPSDLPEGIPENGLYIALWDPDTMSWQDIGGEVDSNAGTVSTSITHLSTYALMAYTRPANLSIATLTVMPAKINPGDSVIINAEVSNQGDLTGVCELCLVVDGVEIETKNVTLPGGESEKETFTIIANTPGEHYVNIGNKQTHFTVDSPLAPPAFTLSELNIDHLTAQTGDTINVSVTVLNRGDLTGEYNVDLKIDDIVVDNKVVSLAGGSSEVVDFSFSSDIAGMHMINIGNLVTPLEIKPLDQPALPPAAVTGSELESFSVSPYFDRETSKLIYARVVYKMDRDWESTAGASLILTVFKNGQDLDRVPLLALDQLQSDGQTGELDYIPTSGWEIGEYTFQAKLYRYDNFTLDTDVERLSVTAEAIATTVSWKILGILICSILAAGVIILVIALYSRRHMLQDYWK